MTFVQSREDVLGNEVVVGLKKFRLCIFGVF